MIGLHLFDHPLLEQLTLQREHLFFLVRFGVVVSEDVQDAVHHQQGDLVDQRAVVLGLMGLWAAAYSDKIDIDFDISVTGILLILLLFVLARVFERGADMREEIEATV